MTEILLTKLHVSAFKKYCNCLSGVGVCCFLLLLPLFLSGCGTVAIIDKNQSDLMPKTVALSIFEKYGFKEWAEQPFMYKGGTEKEFVEFSQINNARYVPLQKKLQFWSFRKFVFFPNITEAQALELTNAARALGAINIDELTYMY